MHPPEYTQHPDVPDYPDPDTATAIVSRLASVKSRQDVKAAMEIYHPDALLLCPPWQSCALGREQVEKGLLGFFGLAPDYAIELAGHAMSGDTLCSWGTARMTLSTTPRGHRPNGRKLSTPAFILFRFAEEKVIWESFHFDLADMARQSGVPVEAFLPHPDPASSQPCAREVLP